LVDFLKVKHLVKIVKAEKPPDVAQLHHCHSCLERKVLHFAIGFEHEVRPSIDDLLPPKLVMVIELISTTRIIGHAKSNLCGDVVPHEIVISGLRMNLESEGPV